MLDGTTDRKTAPKHGKSAASKGKRETRKKRKPKQKTIKRTGRNKLSKEKIEKKVIPPIQIPFAKKPEAEKKKKQKKIVLFRLSDEYYGIDVSEIDEIIDAHINEDITGMPEFVAGVISLRGESIPVLSLKERFHLKESARKETNTILITSKNGEIFGICIDELEGVTDIATSSILAVPAIFSEEEMAYLNGIIKHGMEIAALIDIDLILNNYTLC